MRLIRSKKCIVFMIVLIIFAFVLILLHYNGILGNSSEMPEIVFVCIKYNNGQQGVPEITFIDKYGGCYYSNDSDVIIDSRYGKLIDVYKNGLIEDKIKQLKSCNRNEVRKKYRELCKLAEKAKKGDAVMSTSVFKAFVVGTESKEWCLEGMYFNEYGDVKTIMLKEKGVEYEIAINDPRVDKICEWYSDIMGIT